VREHADHVNPNAFVGTWTYRSLLNDPSLATPFDKLEFGVGTLAITDTAPATMGGTIGGDGWSLNLHGAITGGNPGQVRFQGKGVVGGEEWIYDYIAWLVPVWPNSNDQLQAAALVGSVVRTIPHSNGQGGTSPAGVVASFYAVRQSGA
jgi:hypothetical protein